MPQQGKAWWHIQFGTYCSWLPGEERGFRSRWHEIHSSGDYKNRPPPDEHQGLREYHRSRHPNSVRIPRSLRLIVATEIAESLIKAGHNVVAVSVADQHAHVVAELPVNETAYNKAIGKAKSDSSRRIRKSLPGKVWARDDHHDMIEDRSYQLNSYHYVRDKQGSRAAVWAMDGTRREAFRE